MQPEEQTQATVQAQTVPDGALQLAWTHVEWGKAAAVLSAQALQQRMSWHQRETNLHISSMQYPDSEDEFSVYMLQEQMVEEAVPASSVRDGVVWMLWDSGSSLTTCGINDFADVEMSMPKQLSRTKAATVHSNEVYGTRTVEFEASNKETLSIIFQ